MLDFSQKEDRVELINLVTEDCIEAPYQDVDPVTIESVETAERLLELGMERNEDLDNIWHAYG